MAFWAVGAALIMISATEGEAFVATSIASPRSSAGACSGAARRSPAHGGGSRAEGTLSLRSAADFTAGAEATTAKPKLATAASDFETFFDRYRVRPRGDSESVSAVHAEGNGLLVSGGDEEDVAASLRSGGGESNGVLVVEDLQADDGGGGGNILGFCGAVDSPEAAAPPAAAAAAAAVRPTPSTYYISLREGREIDEPTASLLFRALHGWLGHDAGGDAGWQQQEEEKLVAQGGGSEVVDWVDTMGRVVCALPRPVVHSRNVLHRGAGVMIRNEKGEVYCHRRTSTKRVFPSLYDMFIGGVSGTLEPVATTALRELGEELGLGPYGGGSGSSVPDRAEGEPLPASLRYRGECLVQTGHNRCVVSVFDYRVAPGEEVRWQEEEVDWGSYLPWHEVVSKVSGGDWEFVPDGLQVWRHYLEWEEDAATPSR